MHATTIQPVTAPFRATISPPGSKSLTNRALVLAALAKGTSTLENVLFADDTLIMLDGLRSLGFNLQIDEALRSVMVEGQSGRIPSKFTELFCGNSGTTIRFLTALCSLGTGAFLLDGVPRMRERPIGELVDLLRISGVRLRYQEKEGYPPIVIDADGFPGGIIRFGRAKSSQFLSAVLMVSPYAKHEVSIDLEPGQTSWPYVVMTMRLMDAFGVTAELIRDPLTAEPTRVHVPCAIYTGRKYAIEPDASNATYFLAAAAIHAGASVTIPGLGSHCLQGDVEFGKVLAKMGAEVRYAADSLTVTGPDQLVGIETDLAEMPDTAQTLAVTALFAEGPTTIHGLGTLRVKETDRLAALVTELTKLGANATVEGDSLTIIPPKEIRPAAIDTYDDHRMAMSFALAATRAPGVVINDAQCVSKTYPDYFADLEKVLRGSLL